MHELAYVVQDDLVWFWQVGKLRLARNRPYQQIQNVNTRRDETKYASEDIWGIC